MTVAGLFLTRFFLFHLGQSNYGYWIIASQLLGFAALLDLGVVAVLPREIAYITGQPSAAEQAERIKTVLESVSTIVFLQLPLVAGMLFIGWLLLPSTWEGMRWPLALLLGGFLLSFPLRIPTAILTGLQDLGFLSAAQLICWCAGTALTVALVMDGFGLTALVAGYVATQLLTSVWAVVRLKRRWPAAIPRRLAWPGREYRRYLTSAGWAIVGQVAQLFILGTEGVIVGYLFGPALVVPYTTTGKLLSVLANQPNLVMAAAAPGLSEARMATDGRTRLRISVALGQGMLILTAVIVVVIIAINEVFISWWLGPAQYGGLLLTVIFGGRLFLRQWNTTLIYTLFSFGHERRLALVALADGILTLILSFLFGHQFGPVGVPLGALVGVLLVSLPLNLVGIQSDTGVPLAEVAGSQLWWTWRALLLAAVAAFASTYWNDSSLTPVLVKTLLALLACLAVLGPLMLRPPLGPYVRPRLDLVMVRLGLSGRGTS
jgi:O-antigen/teichoic acid export membrane protein